MWAELVEAYGPPLNELRAHRTNCCERRKSRAAARRRSERRRCERRSRGGFRDVRAAVLEEEMTEQRFSVPAAPTKTAAIKRTSQRAKRAIQQSAMREQLQ